MSGPVGNLKQYVLPFSHRKAGTVLILPTPDAHLILSQPGDILLLPPADNIKTKPGTHSKSRTINQRRMALSSGKRKHFSMKKVLMYSKHNFA